jgi:prefoldin subunit 5
VIANNRGYYISDDIGDINNQIESLQNRISAITLAIDGLKNCRIAISNNNI